MNCEKEYKVIIYFREIGYFSTIADMYVNGKLLNTTYFREKDVVSIKDMLFNLYIPFEIKYNYVEYRISPELMRIITQRTLLNTKTVWELFRDVGIEIKEGKANDINRTTRNLEKR